MSNRNTVEHLFFSEEQQNITCVGICIYNENRVIIYPDVIVFQIYDSPVIVQCWRCEYYGHCGKEYESLFLRLYILMDIETTLHELSHLYGEIREEDIVGNIEGSLFSQSLYLRCDIFQLANDWVIWEETEEK